MLFWQSISIIGGLAGGAWAPRTLAVVRGGAWLSLLWLGGMLLAGCQMEAGRSAARLPTERLAGLWPTAFSPRLLAEAHPATNAYHDRHHTYVLRPGETMLVLPWAQGGTRWTYEPNLTASAVDFNAAAQARQGLLLSETGLAGPGWCEIPFCLPEPLADAGGGLSNGVAARLTLCAAGQVQLAVSDAFGNWLPQPLVATGCEETVVLPLAGRHAFAIRLALGAQSQVSRFRFEGVLAPMPDMAPVLEEGINIMQLHSKDRFGLATLTCELPVDFQRNATVPLEQRVNVREGEVRALDASRLMIAPQGHAAAEVLLAFEAPAGEQFAWFALQSVVQADARRGPVESVAMAWRRDGDDFRAIADTTVKADATGRLTYEGVVLLDRAAARVLARVSSPWPVQAIRFTGQLDRSAVLPVRPTVVHRWREHGAERQFQAPSASDRYYFRCGPQPTAHAVEMSVPSRMITIVNDAMLGL
jgi:hypothetical protein